VDSTFVTSGALTNEINRATTAEASLATASALTGEINRATAAEAALQASINNISATVGAIGVTPVSVSTPICLNVGGSVGSINSQSITCTDSTNNSTWKDIADMKLTTASLASGVKILVVGSINAQVAGPGNNTNSALSVRLLIDGNPQPENVFSISGDGGAAGEVVIPITQTLTTTSSGVHTITVQWRNAAGLSGSGNYFYSQRRIMSATSAN
jgi:hypothetical protein